MPGRIDGYLDDPRILLLRNLPERPGRKPPLQSIDAALKFLDRGLLGRRLCGR
ncbi:hypothetical protein MFUL124B02_36095 [Myxococcus fulvus 124B02]|nr:hypothetical protein MFUL124B02_36095 [Myxococcus fulvus 124B02]